MGHLTPADHLRIEPQCVALPRKGCRLGERHEEVVDAPDIAATHIELDREKKPPKLSGYGLKFFYAQLMMGDSVDNIPGLPRCGAVKAYDVLFDAFDEAVMFERVRAEYEMKGFGDEYLLEQGQLLWMTRRVAMDGNPVLWQFPE